MKLMFDKTSLWSMNMINNLIHWAVKCEIIKDLTSAGKLAAEYEYQYFYLSLVE